MLRSLIISLFVIILSTNFVSGKENFNFGFRNQSEVSFNNNFTKKYTNDTDKIKEFNNFIFYSGIICSVTGGVLIISGTSFLIYTLYFNYINKVDQNYYIPSVLISSITLLGGAVTLGIGIGLLMRYFSLKLNDTVTMRFDVNLGTDSLGAGIIFEI